MELLIIPHDSIEVGERFRKDYGDVDELSNSIKKQGLIQPLAVTKNPNPDSVKPYLLLAGGRRHKALELADFTDIPVRLFSRSMNELELRSIELAENLYRKDLEWTEQIALQRKIHDLQIEIHGEKFHKHDTEGWGLADTAELVGVSVSSVSKDVSLAKAVEAVPELFEDCGSKSDAAKILKQVGEQMMQAEMLKRAKTAPTASAKKALLDCYINEDFFTGVKNIPDKSINFVELDPPYAIDLHKAKRTENGNLDAYNEVAAVEYLTFMRKVFDECYRTMTEHSFMIVWFAPEPWFEPMYQTIISAGFTANRLCGVWAKPSGQTKRPETNLANAYEMFFIARKGKPALAQQGRSNLFNFNPVAGQLKIHPTERPLELIQEILQTFCTPGSRVLVPFLGSGTTLLAASTLQMSGIGYEISKEYKDRYIIKVHKMDEL